MLAVSGTSNIERYDAIGGRDDEIMKEKYVDS